MSEDLAIIMDNLDQMSGDFQEESDSDDATTAVD